MGWHAANSEAEQPYTTRGRDAQSARLCARVQPGCDVARAAEVVPRDGGRLRVVRQLPLHRGQHCRAPEPHACMPPAHT